MKILYTTFAILIGFFSFQANIQSVRAEVTSDVTITLITTMTGGPLSVTDISHFIVDADGTNIPYTGSNSPQIFNLHSGHIAFKIHPLDGYDVTLDNCNTDEVVPADTVKTCTISYVYNGTPENGFDDIVGTTTTETATSTNTNGGSNGFDDVQGSGNNGNATSTNTGGTTNGGDDTNQSTTTPPVSTITPETNPQQTVFYGSGGSSGGSSGSKSLFASGLPALTDLANCSYLTSYLNFNSDNNTEQVVKLQTFLKNYENLDVNISGFFDQKTLDAVKSFQSKYLNEIMTPWGETAPSGYVFYTTQKKINEIYCKATFALTPAQLAAIEKYRKNIENGNLNAVIENDNSTTTPVEVGTNDIQSPENLGDTQAASAIGAFAKFWSSIWNFFKNIFSAIF